MRATLRHVMPDFEAMDKELDLAKANRLRRIEEAKYRVNNLTPKEVKTLIENTVKFDNIFLTIFFNKYSNEIVKFRKDCLLKIVFINTVGEQ